MRRWMTVLLSGAALLGASAMAHPVGEDATAHYLANEGVVVTQGRSKIAFDPFFHNDVRGTYQLVPEAMRAKVMAGEAPYDGIDLVLISHAHGDHFDAGDMLAYLRAHERVQLVAPTQAVDLMKAELEWDAAFADRILALDMDYATGADPDVKKIRIRTKTVADSAEVVSLDLLTEAIRIPHAGGPGRRDIQNMVYRVTLDDAATVMHLGDATPEASAFAPYADHFAARVTDTAFVPSWFFASLGGAGTRQMLNAADAIGVHVQRIVPAGVAASGEDYFSVPGETRDIHTHSHD